MPKNSQPMRDEQIDQMLNEEWTPLTDEEMDQLTPDEILVHMARILKTQVTGVLGLATYRKGPER